jgi:hypothetical protein
MIWQNNLFSNLLVVSILGAMIVIIYCKVTGSTLRDLIISIREGLSAPVE